jgi:Ubiquitin-2 like Rad60 SUMO-like
MAEASKEPGDKATLTFLLVSGEKQDFLVNPADSIDTVCQTVFTNWPKEWANLPVKPIGPANLKVLLRGKFLERATTVACNTS